jgi:hypothetical protein
VESLNAATNDQANTEVAYSAGEWDDAGNESTLRTRTFQVSDDLDIRYNARRKYL